MVRGVDYTATDGTTVTGLTALVADDVVEVFSVVARTVADVYTQTQIDSKLGAGGWTSYTPTFTNFTLGNGTIERAHYVQIGKTVHLDIYVVLGSTSAVSGRIGISLPVTALYAFTPTAVTCALTAGAANSEGRVAFASTTRLDLYALNVAGTYPANANISSTVPGTWAASSFFAFKLTYEAA
jgi:hypothetical protein